MDNSHRTNYKKISKTLSPLSAAGPKEGLHQLSQLCEPRREKIQKSGGSTGSWGPDAVFLSVPFWKHNGFEWFFHLWKCLISGSPEIPSFAHINHRVKKYDLNIIPKKRYILTGLSTRHIFLSDRRIFGSVPLNRSSFKTSSVHAVHPTTLGRPETVVNTWTINTRLPPCALHYRPSDTAQHFVFLYKRRQAKIYSNCNRTSGALEAEAAILYINWTP